MKSIALVLVLLCGCATKAYVRQQVAVSVPKPTPAKDVPTVNVLSLNGPIPISWLATRNCKLPCPACGHFKWVPGRKWAEGIVLRPGNPFTELELPQQCECCKLSWSYKIKVTVPETAVEVESEPAAKAARSSFPPEDVLMPPPPPPKIPRNPLGHNPVGPKGSQ